MQSIDSVKLREIAVIESTFGTIILLNSLFTTLGELTRQSSENVLVQSIAYGRSASLTKFSSWLKCLKMIKGVFGVS